VLISAPNTPTLMETRFGCYFGNTYTYLSFRLELLVSGSFLLGRRRGGGGFVCFSSAGGEGILSGF